jgi:hypothetical protein
MGAGRNTMCHPITSIETMLSQNKCDLFQWEDPLIRSECISAETTNSSIWLISSFHWKWSIRDSIIGITRESVLSKFNHRRCRFHRTIDRWSDLICLSTTDREKWCGYVWLKIGHFFVLKYVLLWSFSRRDAQVKRGSFAVYCIEKSVRRSADSKWITLGKGSQDVKWFMKSKTILSHRKRSLIGTIDSWLSFSELRYVVRRRKDWKFEVENTFTRKWRVLGWTVNQSNMV